MLFRHFASAMLLFVAPAAPLVARTAVGGFGTWAAFCDEPKKCFAISEPVERRDGPFLTISTGGPGLIVQVHVGRAVRDATLRVGDLSVALTPRDDDAFADPVVSRRIVAAMRRSEMLSVTGTTAIGRFRHHYPLAGAPSAIDAAALASLR